MTDLQMPSPPSFYTHTTTLPPSPNPSNIILSSTTLPHLLLRTPTPSDAPALLAILSNPLNTALDASTAGLTTLPAINELITQWTTFTTPLERANLVVVAEGQVVGLSGMGWIGTKKSDPNIEIHDHDNDTSSGKRVGAVGIMLNPEVRGKGYAYESVKMVIDHALRVLGIEEVFLGCRQGNKAMRGLMEKRFKLKAEWLDPPDRFGNECDYRVRKGDWEAWGWV